MRKFLALAVVSALAACSGQNATMKDRPTSADSIDGQISEAVRVSDGMSRQVAASTGTGIVTVRNVDKLEQGEQAVPVGVSSGGTDMAPPGVVLPPDALQPISVTWNGELESFLANVASRSGYLFKVSGQRPATPMMIALVADEEPMFGVVRRAGNMASGYADVVFNAGTKVIEIRYRG